MSAPLAEPWGEKLARMIRLSDAAERNREEEDLAPLLYGEKTSRALFNDRARRQGTHRERGSQVRLSEGELAELLAKAYVAGRAGSGHR